ncbi:hypothetical protein K2173_018339 [Erythroxylum novogranatense]|uniref:Uncharacterized protein n=1 Tax=Erythroxylum novogranatense TaxID=1862640 RepID=A0AAV8UA00_9ROSI|nr:hypothetical protein K2173_018339 [Erythroxylum novogranatense]
MNMDQFDAYFKVADLDGDGRISGAEAVSFFQGSNLSKQVLAQIWTFADQSHSGFLGRAEFYNALRLVTVAQSKRQLTPDIVKAALYGPAAAKIPAPQINLQQQASSMLSSASATQMGAAGAPRGSQNLGFGGPEVPNASMNQQFFPSQPNQTSRQTHPAPAGTDSNFSIMGQAQVRPTASVTQAPQSMTSVAGIATGWLAGKTSGALTATVGISPAMQIPALVSSKPLVNNSRELVTSGNESTKGGLFDGDTFSATPSTKKQEPSISKFLTTTTPATSITVPASTGFHPPVVSSSFDSLQSTFAMQPLGGQLQRAQSLPTSGQQASAQNSSLLAAAAALAGVGTSSDTSQLSWPSMKTLDIQKYNKVFMEVDTDRDGRITGEQARNLFLSWRLPREILKQVWDLSDQDNDSMLSLREFCFALYLMERYREGRTLPPTLPRNVLFDETLLSMTGQPKVGYGNAAWGPNPGFGQQPGTGAQTMPLTTVVRPPVLVIDAQSDGGNLSNQQDSRAPILEDSFLNQRDISKQNLGNSLPQDHIASEKKASLFPSFDLADEPEKVILDSREKLDFYRTMMQDLVLYKSRCDTRLNEITERALADKREAELLGKKYEEKYKQVSEVASKLTIEEATLRGIQERKIELHQAIVNVEQGGSADGILQVRADRIQSDLDALMKALIERCKKHGFGIKSAAIIDLPLGWQPGIQEDAAAWDEEWDKFEDDGFASELTVDVKNVSVSSKQAPSPEGGLTPNSMTNCNFLDGGEPLESESAYSNSEDELARSPRDSPAGRTALENPSNKFSDVFDKSTLIDAETHRSFDESTWGAFDTPDDVDSVWGLNPSGTRESDSDKHGDFFGSEDFGVKPIRTESPPVESVFQKSSFFEDSVPGTPLSRFGNSPRYSEAGDNFDNFSRFDSFSMNDSPKQGRLTRFDSVNSAKEFGHTRGFSSFDDTDPFGSSGPFKVSSDNQTPKKGPEHWGAF